MAQNNSRSRKALLITWIGFIVNIILVVFKLFIGLIGRSEALIADAAHSLSDFSSDIVILLGFRVARKPVDKTHDYGHGKFETLSTLIVGIILLIVGVGIFFVATEKIVKAFQGSILEQPEWITLFAAGISIIIKEILYRYTIKIGKDIKSDALIVNAWHHRSDALTSLGIFFGIGGAILLGRSWRVLDPIAAGIVSLFIIKISLSVLIRSIKEFLEASLSEETEEKIEEIINNVAGVRNIHNLKTRKIGDTIAIDVHVKVDKTLTIVEAHNISSAVEKELENIFGEKTLISVHIEPNIIHEQE